MATTIDPVRAAMERNLRILPWWWVVRWIWLGEAVWVIYLIRDRGLSLGEVLVFDAIFSVIAITAELPTGMVADRFGRRSALLLASTITVFAFITFGLAPTIPILLGAYALFAVADAFMSGADNAFVFDTLQELGRGEDFTRTVARMNAIQTAAVGLFTVAGGVMVAWTPLSTPIVLGGVLTVPAIGLALMLRDPPRRGPRPSFLATGAGAARRVGGSSPLRTMIMLATFGSVAIAIMGITIQPVVVSYGVPTWTLGLFVGSQLALSSLGAWSAPAIGRRLGLRRMMLSMGLLAAFSLFGGASGVIWLFPLFIMASVSWNVIHPHVAGYLSHRAAQHERATVLSIHTLFERVVMIAATLLMALVVDQGLGLALGGAGGALVVLVVASYVLWVRSGDTAPEPASPPEAR